MRTLVNLFFVYILVVYPLVDVYITLSTGNTWNYNITYKDPRGQLHKDKVPEPLVKCRYTEEFPCERYDPVKKTLFLSVSRFNLSGTRPPKPL